MNVTSLGLRCDHWPGSHNILKGKDQHGFFKTSSAQEYPIRYCEAIALCFVEHLIRFDLPSTKDIDGDFLHGAPGVSRTTPDINIKKCDRDISNILCDWPWKSCFSKTLHSSDHTHINEKELRAARLWIRRITLRGPKHAARHILLCDSRVVTGAINHGRSPSRRINRLLRSFVAELIGSESYVNLTWISSESNPSDPLSRNRALWPWLVEARTSKRTKQRTNENARQRLRWHTKRILESCDTSESPAHTKA